MRGLARALLSSRDSLALLPHQFRMRGAKNDIDGVRARFDDFRHRISMVSMPLFGDKRPKVRMIIFPSEVELRLGVMRFKEREIGNSVRYDLNLAIGHVMNGTEKFVTFFRHDYNFCRNIYDPAHHVVLDGCRFGKHRVQLVTNRHFEAR